MSAWVLGLALSAGYLINRNLQIHRRLETATQQYQNAAAPATGGVTTEEVRTAWKDTVGTKIDTMAEELTSSQKALLHERVQQQRQVVDQFDAPSTPQIEGVMLHYAF